MNRTNTYITSVLRNINSALRYEAVTYISGEYIPDYNMNWEAETPAPFTPFKGLHISVPGNVAIRGVDNNVVVLTLPIGCWPYGGIGILQSGTTSTGIVALF